MTKGDRPAIARLELPLGAIGVTLAALSLLFAHSGIPRWIPPALTAHLGVASPLSGMTRSFVALASCNVVDAFRWHPLGPVVFAACVLLPAVAIASFSRARRFAGLARVMRSRGLWIGVAVLFTAVWARQIAFFG